MCPLPHKVKPKVLINVCGVKTTLTPEDKKFLDKLAKDLERDIEKAAKSLLPH